MTRFAKKLVFFIIIIILLIGAFFYFRKTPTVNNNSDQSTNVTTSSIKGCYVAKLSKDVYVLSIDSQTNESVSGMLAYNNFEKDSSSGTFKGTFIDDILVADYLFQSEGMDSNRQVVFKKVGDSFVQGFGPTKIIDNKEVIDNASISYDPKSTFIKSDNCSENFKDSNNTFTFDYNPLWKIIEGNKIPSIDWRVNTKDKGLLLAQVIAPKAYLPKTNFGDAKFTVGRSTDAKVIKSCTNIDTINNEFNSKSLTTIGGYPFSKFTSNGAGAGNFYETTSYRGIVDGDCYAIEYTIHSTNIGNYSPDQGIKEFDKNKIQSELERIIRSFKFLINSN
jgi:hypothetical protein